MKSFQRIIFLCIIGTYSVILAGAVVRGTGSGLGCPDWPRCFGQWVPPMDIHDLPENYKEVYKIAGKTIADFDPFKTWTEYINRLLGVILGLGIVTLFIKSFGLKEHERNLPWFCGGLLFLVMIQGGIGANDSILAISWGHSSGNLKFKILRSSNRGIMSLSLPHLRHS